jgi:hypothetical protein
MLCDCDTGPPVLHSVRRGAQPRAKTCSDRCAELRYRQLLQESALNASRDSQT